MNKQEQLDKLLRKAKIVTNLGVAIFVFTSVIAFTFAIFPNALTFNQSNDSGILKTEVITEYVAGQDIDPNEIKNGIHLPTGLIIDDGVELVIGTCTACHSSEIVTQNRADREGWKDIIVWMQKTQKLWDLGESEDLILTYLAKNYAPKDTGRRRNLENIEWYDL